MQRKGKRDRLYLVRRLVDLSGGSIRVTLLFYNPFRLPVRSGKDNAWGNSQESVSCCGRLIKLIRLLISFGLTLRNRSASARATRTGNVGPINAVRFSRRSNGQLLRISFFFFVYI